MAFNLISAESLEVLADELSRNLYSGVSSVLEMPKIVIQSQGMEKWLSLRVADNLGVTAGVEFLFLNGFFQEVILEPFASEREIELSMLLPSHLKWIIFSILGRVGDNPEFRVVNSYIGGEQLKQLQISQKLAEIYDRYSLYRADWLTCWEVSGADGYEGEEGSGRWLAELWKLVKQETNMSSVAELSKQCMDWLRTASSFSSAPIHLFGVSSMPPLYLSILSEVSKRMDVYFYYLEVSHEYWGLVRSEKDLLRKAGSNYEVGNTLLATFGERNRDFLNLLITLTSDSGIQESERVVTGSIDDVTSDDLPLIRRIQAGIRFMELPARKSRVYSKDSSIEFHSCYGKMRQVESLYNSLLGCFDSDPSIKPKDILVLTPSIKDFVPYIRAVFGSVQRDSGKYIPFTISDRAVMDENKVCQALFSTLKLLSGRFKVSEVWSVFCEPAYEESKGILSEYKEDALRWINELQVHWGIDSSQREKYGSVRDGECSWQEAEERLLLGYAFGASGDNIFTLRDGREVSGIDVSSSVSSLQAWLEFLSNLFVLNRRFTRVSTAGEWIEFARNIVEIFFSGIESDAQEVMISLTELSNVFEEVGVLGEKMSFNVFSEELKSALENSTSGAGFIMGGVTFCQFQPMRNIPAKVICMLGMDDGAFPRIEKPTTFDIATREKRLCDPSLRRDDQGVFLETILSVSERLLVFYSGHGARRGEELAPAAPVEILREYIGRYYQGENSDESILEQITLVHPLQSFSKEYFTGSTSVNSLVSYSEEDLAVAKMIYGKKSSSVTYYSKKDDIDIVNIISEGSSVELSDLINFYKNPSKWYLRNKCSIFYDLLEKTLPSDEDRVSTDNGYKLGNIKNEIVRERVAGFAKDDIVKRIGAMRVLPLGRYADSEFDKLYAETEMLTRIMTQIDFGLGDEVSGELSVDVCSDGHDIFGSIDLGYTLPALDFMEGELVSVRFGFNKSISWGYLVEAWLEHLVYSAVLSPSILFSSLYYGVDGKLEYVYSRIEQDSAKRMLGEYLHGFCIGSAKPLAIFKGASARYAASVLKEKSNEDAIFDARSAYVANPFSFPDVNDEYILKCFGDDFTLNDEFLKEFVELAERFVMPVYRCNQANLSKVKGA